MTAQQAIQRPRTSLSHPLQQLRPWAGWFLCAISVLLLALAILFSVHDAHTHLPIARDLHLFRTVVFDVGLLGFPIMGAVIFRHEPKNEIGRLFSVVGVLLAVEAFGLVYGFDATDLQPRVFPDGVFIAWIATWIWPLPTFLCAIFLPLLFPTGYPLSRRWGYFGVACAIGTALFTITQAFSPHPLAIPGHVANPVALPGSLGTSDRTAGLVLQALLILAGLGAIVSLLIRWRHSSMQVRQQLKLPLYTMAVLTGAFLVAYVSLRYFGLKAASFDLAMITAAAAYLLLPIAAGVATLNYRLYGINFVVYRALVSLLLASMIGGLTAAIGAILTVIANVVAGAHAGLRTTMIAAVVIAFLGIGLFEPIRLGLVRLQESIVERWFTAPEPSPDHESAASRKDSGSHVEGRRGGMGEQSGHGRSWQMLLLGGMLTALLILAKILAIWLSRK